MTGAGLIRFRLSGAQTAERSAGGIVLDRQKRAGKRSQGELSGGVKVREGNVQWGNVLHPFIACYCLLLVSVIYM